MSSKILQFFKHIKLNKARQRKMSRDQVRNIKELIPPRSLNYNYHGSRLGYQRRVFADTITLFYPQLLALRAEHNAEDAIRFLDIGCGFGPMAAAFTSMTPQEIGAPHVDQRIIDQPKRARYLGIDIREDSIQWLSRAYKFKGDFQFVHHQVDPRLDYVLGEESKLGSVGSSNGDAQGGRYPIPVNFLHNLQWSSSLFTHLTPDVACGALQSISDSAEPGGLQVNTWLILDEMSEYCMNVGLADRTLPYEFDAFRSYSKTNPLVCTAYKLDFLRSAYGKVGLEILDILPGSWRSSGIKNRFGHYQDVVVSRSRIGEN